MNHKILMQIGFVPVAVIPRLRRLPIPYWRKSVISALYGTSCTTWFTHLQPSTTAYLWDRHNTSQYEEEWVRERIYLSVCLKSGGPLFLSNRRLGKILKLVYNNIPGYLCIRMDSHHHTNGPGTIWAAWRMALAWAYYQGIMLLK